MHGHGKRAAVRVIRAGAELAPLAVLDPWDESQGPLRMNVPLLPGDTLILNCTYDNDLDHALVYGDGIDREMCGNFDIIPGHLSRIHQLHPHPHTHRVLRSTSCQC